MVAERIDFKKKKNALLKLQQTTTDLVKAIKRNEEMLEEDWETDKSDTVPEQ